MTDLKISEIYIKARKSLNDDEMMIWLSLIFSKMSDYFSDDDIRCFDKMIEQVKNKSICI